MSNAKSAETIQREYYARTALQYEDSHVSGGPEHNVALRYISGLLQLISAKTALDVGCGTGRGIAHVRRFHPDIRAFGLEPVEQLLEVAVSKGVPPSALVRGDASRLPFEDRTFDAVMELGVLHHVPRPEIVVAEMLRVARKAVFISDANLFGQGRRSLRVLKYVLYRARLWKLVKYIQTGGHGYILNEGDGLSYSYSAYFQYGLLSRWASRIIAVPLISDQRPAGWPRPLFDDACVLLCAIRDEQST